MRTHTTSTPHRSLSTILAIIQAAPLTEAVKQRAARAFQLLGEAEAAIHSIPIEKVHFHEVGAVDTIVDIVCAAAGCEALGVDRWMASPLNVGSGTVKCAARHAAGARAGHAGAAGRCAGVCGRPADGASDADRRGDAAHAGCEYGPLPAMRVTARGYGAGGRDTPGEPNLLRLLVGESGDAAAESRHAEPIAVIETVIDDSTPQLLAYVSELLLEAGAWDVYRAPVQMKKGRTGVQMTVLSQPETCACAARSAVARDHDDRLALAAGKQDGSGARVCRGAKPSGARCGSKLRAGLRAKWPTHRRSTRSAAILRARTRFR